MNYIAGWTLTDSCNLNCGHCYNDSGKTTKYELSLDECFAVADKLKKYGVVAVNFGGGECALSSKFIPLCKYLNTLGIKISYTTNGTTFDYIKDYLYLFHDVGVSIDFANAVKHDLLRGKNGVYNEAVETIKQLVANKVNTEIVTCLTKLNCSNSELEAIYALSKELRVDNWRINRFRTNGRGKENISKLKLSQSDLKNAYSYISHYIPKDINVPEPLFRAAFGGNYLITGDPSGIFAFRIQANGDVTPSVFLHESGGNVVTQSLDTIFDSEIFVKIRNRKISGKCNRCSAYIHCNGGDIGASYLENNNFDGPDPLCWLDPDKVINNSQLINGLNWNVHELYLCTIYVPINNI